MIIAFVCWVGTHFVLLVGVVILALWPLFLFLLLIVALLGVAIHPKSLNDLFWWLISLPARFVRFLWDFPRTEWVTMNPDWLCHGWTVSSFCLLHPDIRRAWSGDRVAALGRYRAIPRTNIQSIRLGNDSKYQILLIEHDQGIEEIGFGLTLDDKLVLLELLLTWLKDGSIQDIQAIKNSVQAP